MSAGISIVYVKRPQSGLAVEASGLVKVFGTTRALDGLDLSVPLGCVYVRALAAEGTTVLLTTQYLDEVDHLADRIAVIDTGKVIAEGTSGELKASVGAGVLRVRLRDPAQRSEAEPVLRRALDEPVHLGPDASELSARTSAEPATHALIELSRQGIAVAEFALGQPSLDEVFFSLTGHRAEVGVSLEEDVA